MNDLLSTRVLLRLTLAILPLGLVAVHQTATVIYEAELLARREVLARASEAAWVENAMIERALGAGLALAGLAGELDNDPERCNAVLRRMASEGAELASVGLLGPDGSIRCASANALGFKAQEEWLSFRENPRPKVLFDRAPNEDGPRVLVATVPILDEAGVFAGAASVAVPHNTAEILRAANRQWVDLAIVDGDGALVVAGEGMDWFEGVSIAPRSLVIASGGTFLRDLEGAEGGLAIVPLSDGDFYVVGARSGDEPPMSRSFLGASAATVPVIMWLAGLLVAFLAINRLVLRHLKRLRDRMAAFSLTDLEGSYVSLPRAPAELQAIVSGYNTMIDRIAEDRERLEASVQEKDVLLKEVHHRVKNNLQLISSILNMQIRATSSPDSQHVLRRFQDRVMSLAAIHEVLYTETLAPVVRADRILAEIVDSTLNAGLPAGASIATSIDLSPLYLVPDQAVPLSLLAAEAVSNAMTHASAPPGETASVRLSVKCESRQVVRVTISNSLGTVRVLEDSTDTGTGLGARLIEAFAAQLGGELEIAMTECEHTLSVSFAPATASPERP